MRYQAIKLINNATKITKKPSRKEGRRQKTVCEMDARMDACVVIKKEFTLFMTHVFCVLKNAVNKIPSARINLMCTCWRCVLYYHAFEMVSIGNKPVEGFLLFPKLTKYTRLQVCEGMLSLFSC